MLPTGWPRASAPAVDIDVVEVRFVNLSPGQCDGCECFVDLEQIEGRRSSFRSSPGRDWFACTGPSRWNSGSEPTQRLGDDAGARLQSERASLVLVHEQDCGRAVGDLGRRSGRVNPAFEDGLQSGKGLRRRIAQALIAIDDLGLAREVFLPCRPGVPRSSRTSRSKRPSSQACLASGLRADAEGLRRRRGSVRVGRAMRSAASNWLGMSMSHVAGRRGPA